MKLSQVQRPCDSFHSKAFVSRCSVTYNGKYKILKKDSAEILLARVRFFFIFCPLVSSSFLFMLDRLVRAMSLSIEAE